MELVPNERYLLTWKDDLRVEHPVHFVCFERGFYVFRSFAGERVIARPTSIIIRLYNENG